MVLFFLHVIDDLVFITLYLAMFQDSSKPYVAAIMGTCLGGGLEVWLHVHVCTCNSWLQ